MTESNPPNSDPNEGPEMARLRKLAALPQARLDTNFVVLVGQMRTAVEAMYRAILHAGVDQAAALDDDVRKAWQIQIVLLTAVARNASIVAEEVDIKARRLLSME